MPIAVSYIRFSTPKQSLGDSLRRQLEHTRAYCAAHGLTLDEDLFAFVIVASARNCRLQAAEG